MESGFEIVAGDTPGLEWRVPVLRFAGEPGSGAPSAYLQAALHGDELPGVATLHVLAERLRTAEARGDLRGNVTVVPMANPIGISQFLFGAHVGRYDLGGRGNFNREHPVLDRADRTLLPPDVGHPADVRLKSRLVSLALDAEIVLDLHCDEQSLPYLYIHAALWPAMTDLAAAMATDAVLTWDGDGGRAFEEAALAPHLADIAGLSRRAVSTVELRGQLDVTPAFAEADAAGLMRFLAGRGVVAGPGPEADWSGPVAPLEHVEVVRTPVGGVVVYAVDIGDTVAEGDLLATLLVRPGEADGAVAVHAPQAGLVLSRRDIRVVRGGDDLLKIVGTRRSPTAKPGPLEQ